MNDDVHENNVANNYKINENKTTTSRFFYYLTKIIGNTPNDNNTLDKEAFVPLLYLIKFS